LFTGISFERSNKLELENILLNYDASCAFIKINRPEVRNAMNDTTINEINLALTEIEKRQDTKIVIFTGTGEKAFSAGADISNIAKRTISDALIGKHSELCTRIENFELPTISMINGYALGGGFELALACDIRVVSENAKFGLPELNLSIIPGAGGTQRLTRIVGISRALDMIMTGKIISAEEAFQLGIAQYTSSLEELYETTMGVVEKILEKGPLAVQLVRHAIKRGIDIDQDTALYLEKVTQAVLYTTKDKVEGPTAFLEKRKPNFKKM
jgi:enoyl-CoA hydratase